MIWIFIFGIALPALLVLHPYLIYPLSLGVFSKPRQRPQLDPFDSNLLPEVEVVLSARNEELVLEHTLQSLLSSEYPAEKLRIALGSDASTDATTSIARKYADQSGRIRLEISEERLGKANMLNRLVEKSQAEFLLFTDANVRFEPRALLRLVECALAREADMVGGALRDHVSASDFSGHAVDEARYLEFENRLRSCESDRWGLVIGLEGGAMLLKRSCFQPIPPGTTVDDFFQNLAVLKRGGRVLFEPAAVAWESDTADAREEYRRKKRIGHGNRQNLLRFFSLIWKSPFPLGYALLSHKFLRWFAGVWAIWLGIGLFLAAWEGSEPATVLFVAFFSVTILSLGPLRRSPVFGSIGHFVRMNAALIEGLLLPTERRSHLWEPTQRNDSTPHD